MFRYIYLSMFTNEQRHCYVDAAKIDRSYRQAIHPTITNSDSLHNEGVGSFQELYSSIQQNGTIRKLADQFVPFYLDDLTLKFSRIAENYRDALQKLHDTTLQALKDACLAVAKEIDEEAKSRFALGDDCPHAKAAENATRRHVFGYNENARLKRDSELREDFRLRLSRAKIA